MRLVYLICSLLAISGCEILNGDPTSSRTSLPTDGVAAYFPAEYGRQWVYETVLGSIGPADWRDTVTVTDITGNRVTLSHTYGDRRYVVSADSVSEIIERTGNEDDEIAPLLPWPLVIGNRWQTFHADHEIIDTDQTIHTPAGTFSDVVVVRSNPCAGTRLVFCKRGQLIYDYYARGVGLIKSEDVNPGYAEVRVVNTTWLLAVDSP